MKILKKSIRPTIINFIIAVFVFLMIQAGGIAGCGNSDLSQGTLNPNFSDFSDSPIAPTISIESDNPDKVVTIQTSGNTATGQVGIIADQDPNHVLCVIVDPVFGDNVDLEVCQVDTVNNETDSINGLCPEADQETRCASTFADSGPDFCEVTGATDYAVVIINPTLSDATAAYQVVDVTGYDNPSCAGLIITEDSIKADE